MPVAKIEPKFHSFARPEATLGRSRKHVDIGTTGVDLLSRSGPHLWPQPDSACDSTTIAERDGFIANVDNRSFEYRVLPIITLFDHNTRFNLEAARQLSRGTR